MAIYGRFGDAVKILRMGTLVDVKVLDKRKPDKRDRAAVANGSYVVVRFGDGEPGAAGEQLYSLAFLRADGGLPEIMDAVRCLDMAGEEVVR